MERVTGIEPVYPAWKAGALADVLHPHIGRSRKRSYAQLPMNRFLLAFYTFKLINSPLHKAPSYASVPKVFITNFLRLKLHTSVSMV